MPVEVTDVIDGANATSSSAGRAVSQQDAALLASAKTGDARYMSNFWESVRQGNSAQSR